MRKFLALAIGLLVPSFPLFAACTATEKNADYGSVGGTSSTVTVAAGTAGDLVAFFAWCFQTCTPGTLTLSGGQAAIRTSVGTPGTTVGGDGLHTGQGYIYYILSRSSASAQTATFNTTAGASGGTQLSYIDFSPSAGCTFTHHTDSQFGTGTGGGTANTPSISSVTGDVLVNFVVNTQHVNASVSSPWSCPTYSGSGETFTCQIVTTENGSAYILSASSGTTTTNWGLINSSTGWEAIISSFSLTGANACPTSATYGPTRNQTLAALGVTTCFYIANSGSDTNTGADEAHPWAHAPGMPSCVSGGCHTFDNNSGSNGTAVAGDGFILRGGDTWGSADTTWTWRSSGSLAVPIYVGIDPTWFSGASWTRPILNYGGKSILTQGPVLQFGGSGTAQHNVVDNMEITNFSFADPGGNPNFGAVQVNGSSFNSITNFYIHGWSHTGSTSDVCAVIYGPTSDASFNYNVIDGSDSTNGGDSCYGMYLFNGNNIEVGWNYFNRLPNGTVGQIKFWHDNTYITVADFVTAAGGSYHGNSFENNVCTSPCFLYNNVLRTAANTSPAGTTGYVNFWDSPTGNYDYVFNNVIADPTDETAFATLTDSGAQANGGFFKFFNNTVECGHDSTPPALVCTGDENSTVGSAYLNNHFITSATPPPLSFFATQSNNVTQSKATANGQGYTLAQTNSFSPTSNTNATVGTGLNEQSLCTTISGLNAAAGTACQSDTTYGVGYDTTNHKVIAPARTTNVRPISGAWDSGAYQFSGVSGSWTVLGTMLSCTGSPTGQYTQTVGSYPCFRSQAPSVFIPASALGTSTGRPVYMFADGLTKQSEWGNNFYTYDPTQGTATAAFSVLWQSLNEEGSGNQALSTIARASGVVTGTVPTTGQAPRSFQVGDWIFPNGVTYGGATPFNAMMQVTSVSNCVTVNLACSTFTANQAGEDGSGTGGNVYGPAPRFANLGSCPNLPCGPSGPLPRHNQITVYDSTRNAVWMWGGICDTVAAPGSASSAVVVGVHGGCYEIYKMTKSGANWSFTQVHGFGTTAFNIAAPNQAEPGLNCSSSSNAGNCGYKFSWGGYDPSNDVIVFFGGTLNSSPRNETYVYHPGTDVLNVVCAEVGSPTCATVPAARSAYGDSRLVSIGGGRLLLFGGQQAGSTNNQLGDTWIFNTTNNTWTQPASANGTNPSPGLNLANLPVVMDWDPVLGEVIAVDANPAGSHTWAFDPTALTWTDLNISGGPVLDNTNPLLPEYMGVIDTDYPIGGNGSMIIVNRTVATGVNTFYALSLPASTGPTGQIFNLAAQRITWPSTNGTRPSGPSTNQTNVPVTFAVPVPDSFVSGTLGSCPNGVALYQNSLRVNSQCRMIAGWPDSKSGSNYNAQFIQLDYQYPSFTEGAADTSFVVTFEGAGSGNNPSTSMGITCTGAGTPNAACQNSNQLLVATGAANYLFKKTNTNIVDDLSIGTTHVICSSSSVATGCLNHGANDGIVLFGPPSGQTTPHTVSCPLPAGGSGNGDAGASACTNAYLTSNDSASTAVFEENGPMRTVVKINANLIDGSANNYNEAVTCRITLWANRVDASFECALRNANYSVTANDAVSAYKMHASMYLQYTVSLSTTANTTATFGNHTATPSTISMSATQGGYLTTGHMKYMEDFYFGGNITNCPSGSDHDANCVWAPISRTPGAYPTGATYTQEGYGVTATGGASVTGTASGTNVQIVPGWSDVTDANGLGIEVGEFLMAAYWPASQEYQSGGTVVRVGLNPDESLFGTGGQAYVMGWPKYTLYRSYLNPHIAALTNTQLSDSFLAWQLPVVGQYSSPASYNGAKDNAFGRLALLYPLPDPVVFDNYAINLGGYCPSNTAGSCLPDIGGQGYTGNATIEDGNQAGTMTRFRYYPWGDGGGANQQEWAFSLLNNWLSWKTGGRYLQSWLWYWYVLEGAMPRADWVTVPGGSAAANEQGWRCASAPNCPDIASVPCAALHCANEDNYGHPAQTNINLNGTGLNVAQRNWTPNADNGQHYHWYGMAQFYELTGWEWAKDFLLQAGKDELLNANAIVNDATRSSGGDFIFADRVFGHRWMAYSRLSMFLCAVGDPDCDGNNGSNVSPKALTNAENHAAYGAVPTLIAFGYPLQSGGTPVAQPTGCTTPTTDWGAGCSQGISAVTGFSYGGDENDNALASPSLAPLDNGVHRISQSFFWDRKVNGLLELEWAELSARGAGWKVTNAKNGGVSFGDNCGTTYPCYSLPMLAYGISNSFTQNMYVLGSTFSKSGSVYISYLDYLNSTCGTTYACTTTQTPAPGNGPCDNTALNSGFYCGTNGPPQNIATHWTHFATTCAFSGSTVNFDTADNPTLASGQWQQKFEFLMQRLNTGQSFSEDRSYDLTWAWDCVRKHNPTIASFPLASNIATMQTVTITVTDGTHTGYCIGACTITWTKPLNLSTSGVALPQGNVFYQLVVNECVPGTFGCPSPAGFTVVNWLPFYRNCTTSSTTNECTANTGLLSNNPCNGGLNATDQTSSAISGCWGPVLPTASTNFFTATPIANPSSAATSASFTCPASNVCTFALKGALTQVSAVAPAPAPGLFGK